MELSCSDLVLELVTIVTMIVLAIYIMMRFTFDVDILIMISDGNISLFMYNTEKIIDLKNTNYVTTIKRTRS